MYKLLVVDDEPKIRDIIKKEMLEIKEKYSDERRTEISEAENEIVLEDLIDEAWDKCPPPAEIDFRMSFSRVNRYRVEA